jgi:CRP/FNR family transcriptional regulator
MFSTAQYADDASVMPQRSLNTRAASPTAHKQGRTRDSLCAMRSVCMPRNLTPLELDQFDSLICSTRTITRGNALYRTNDSFQNIYAVHAGSFKTVVMHRDGLEQVTGFHLVGEALGLGGVFADRHSGDAIALEDSIVCVIPFHLLEALCHEVKAVQRHVHRMMSGEIVRESRLMMLLGTMSAEQRVAAFLLNLSQRLNARGYSPAEFNLRMTRAEMGNYLGLKLETVSRMLSKLQNEGSIETHGKQIMIVDFERLERV